MNVDRNWMVKFDSKYGPLLNLSPKPKRQEFDVQYSISKYTILYIITSYSSIPSESTMMGLRTLNISHGLDASSSPTTGMTGA